MDLGKTALVHSVSITNPDGQYLTPFLINFDIRIGFERKTGINPICRKNITINQPITVNFKCNSVTIGQFLFIEKYENKICVCEVEVYGVLLY